MTTLIWMLCVLVLSNVVLASAENEHSMRINSLKSEDQFQKEVHRVIQDLFAVVRNNTNMRNGDRGLEDVAIFFLEIIGSVVGLSWGTYMSIVYAINNANNNNM
ncbi:hypothetical protein L9F63_004109 [Diploptera punctata]|uniref:Uncharacterized protein n=1 Tax=Diploptera punctata TaxID=6984 RepID=A0AAD7ZGU5_DIPPU|nr:hypothetical protein L9F63_004109 [Diploptera punctata]